MCNLEKNVIVLEKDLSNINRDISFRNIAPSFVSDACVIMSGMFNAKDLEKVIALLHEADVRRAEARATAKAAKKSVLDSPEAVNRLISEAQFAGKFNAVTNNMTDEQKQFLGAAIVEIFLMGCKI